MTTEVVGVEQLVLLEGHAVLPVAPPAERDRSAGTPVPLGGRCSPASSAIEVPKAPVVRMLTVVESTNRMIDTVWPASAASTRPATSPRPGPVLGERLVGSSSPAEHLGDEAQVVLPVEEPRALRADERAETSASTPS